jgi:phage protein D
MPIRSLQLGLLIGKSVPKSVTPAVLNALQSVEVNQSDAGPGGIRPGFQITFGAERDDDAKADYRLLQSGLLNPGNRVIITVTLNGRPFVLSDGIITHQQLSFNPGQAGDSLAVMGKDLSVMLDLTEKRESYAGMKHQQVVEKILKAYADLGIRPQVTAPPADWPIQPQEHIPFQHGTDLAYVRDLAAANGYIFYIKPGPQPQKSTAYWGPPERNISPHPALTLNMGVADNVESLNFAYDALAPYQVVRAQPGKDQPTLVEITKSTATTQLARKAALTSNLAFVRQRWLTYAGPDEGEAAARAQGLVDLSTEQVVTAKGSLDALRYGDVLFAPGRVGLRGVGETYDGEYYIRSVKHRINGDSYKQEFTLTREGVGSNTHQVKV